MHLSTTRRHYVGKNGDERTYETHLLRRSVRHGSKVRNETLANLSHLPEQIIEAIKAGLSGETLVVAGSGFDLTRSLPRTPGRGLGHGQDARSARFVGTAV
jgi:hypothetical protein